MRAIKQLLFWRMKERQQLTQLTQQPTSQPQQLQPTVQSEQLGQLEQSSGSGAEAQLLASGEISWRKLEMVVYRGKPSRQVLRRYGSALERTAGVAIASEQQQQQQEIADSAGDAHARVAETGGAVPVQVATEDKPGGGGFGGPESNEKG